jgi:Kef-type K+ transport system membrane component KefB
MELIVLNIGYDLGVLSPTIFTMMILMALVTTFMTAPALYWIERIRSKTESMSAESLPERL